MLARIHVSKFRFVGVKIVSTKIIVVFTTLATGNIKVGNLANRYGFAREMVKKSTDFYTIMVIGLM